MRSDNEVPHSDWIESRVTMREATAQEIREYVDTGEPMDKAGAYALQGVGASLVEKVDGSRDNVIGLPVAEVLDLFDRCSKELGDATSLGPAP